MSNVIIIHGAYGNPSENWFPQLKEELEKEGHRVFVPHFPTPENQNLGSWLEVFEGYKKYFNKDSIVVGHSLGPAFLSNVLERSEKPIRAAFFVAGFIGELNNYPEINKINKTIADRKFDWKTIKKNCQKLDVFQSDNDPYVPIEKGKELAKHLDTEIKLVENAGHFNEDSGYVKFELLLENIKKEL